MNGAIHILHPVNMNFFPFRSSSSSASIASPKEPSATNTSTNNNNTIAQTSPIDDSWHTNAPLESSSNNTAAIGAAPISAPMSWFSSWTTSSTVTSNVTASNNGQDATVITRSVTKHETITTAASSPPNDAHLPKSPSSFNMLRGVESHESEDISKNVNITHNQHLSTREESFSAQMKNAFIGSNAGVGGCMPTTAMSNMNTATNKMEETGEDDLYSIIADVPFSLRSIIVRRISHGSDGGSRRGQHIVKKNWWWIFPNKN